MKWAFIMPTKIKWSIHLVDSVTQGQVGKKQNKTEQNTTVGELIFNPRAERQELSAVGVFL